MQCLRKKNKTVKQKLCVIYVSQRVCGRVTPRIRHSYSFSIRQTFAATEICTQVIYILKNTTFDK